MQLTILVSLFGAAAAFSPSSISSGVRVETSISAKEAAAEALPPPIAKNSQALPFLDYPPNLEGYIGDVGFDPFRFSDFVPVDFLREAELKHGRIAMLAWIGFISVDLGFRIYPLPEAYQGLTSVTAHDALIEQGAMSQIFLWVSVLEVVSTVAVTQMLGGSGRDPGDFGLDPLKFCVDPVKKKELQLQEIKNGRLAMLAFSGVVTQAVLTSGPFPYV